MYGYCFWKKVHNFAFVDVERHWPHFRPLDDLVKGLLNDFTFGSSEDPASNFSIVSKLGEGEFQSCF